MTIKEIEELAGMPRANIRYYEEEGLLKPIRSANGYRDYSEDDLSVLKRIKLLRSLELSLDEIKALHTGKQELSVALEQQIQKLAVDKEKLNKAQIICEAMYRDGIKYENLDAEKYLHNFRDSLKPLSVSENVSAASWKSDWDLKAIYEDTIPAVQSPWRRFFARSLDEAVYATILYVILILVFNENVIRQGSSWALLEIIVILLFTIVLEPLQLTLFGTTFGKWILGLQVLHNDDRKLTFSEAYERTKQVLFYGLGYHIPIFCIIRLWKSYKSCTSGETLEWEYDSRMVLKDEKRYRVIVYVGTRVLLIGVLLFANVLVQIPIHRGELTVAEFAENYRRLAKFYDVDYGFVLDDDGIWKDPLVDEYVIYSPGYDDGPPEFVFETDSEGNIKKISFVVEYSVSAEESREERQIISTWQSQMQLAMLAFVGARDEFSQFSSMRQEMLQHGIAHEYEGYEFTEAGVTVCCDMQWQGYEPIGSGLLMPLDEGDCSFYLEFTMNRQE